MGTGRTLNKNPRTRPIKSQGEKRRRYKVQRARLVKLGMDEAVVAKLQPNELRTLVQHPTKVKKMVAPKAPKAAKPAKAKPEVVAAAEPVKAAAKPRKAPAAKKAPAKKAPAKKAPAKAKKAADDTKAE
ncbi:MAG: hypothetical protein RBU24_08315 [Kiritimatiellia bacterium]|jgi:hypothetical protein|nr:hypothetical protein [Kiritimatiellia bacterium]HPB12188.1 hypothetical protein [Kiritimatiellia bacterium]